jgi:hypothetical protein
MPKHKYSKLNTYPIQQILDIKNTTRKDSYQTHKIKNKCLCKWILPNNTTYTRMILEKYLFPYNKNNNTATYNISLLKQYYINKQNKHYSNTIQALLPNTT